MQFAVNPKDGRMVVIEMNPQVSRSSALASKATGFPIAKWPPSWPSAIHLDELKNDITGAPASFEPSIDYVVTKVPRFAFEIPAGRRPPHHANEECGRGDGHRAQFQESLQKALRGLEVGVDGFNLKNGGPGENRRRTGVPARRAALVRGGRVRHRHVVGEIHGYTKIDPWFLAQIKELVDLELELEKSPSTASMRITCAC